MYFDPTGRWSEGDSSLSIYTQHIIADYTDMYFEAREKGDDKAMLAARNAAALARYKDNTSVYSRFDDFLPPVIHKDAEKEALKDGIITTDEWEMMRGRSNKGTNDTSQGTGNGGSVELDYLISGSRVADGLAGWAKSVDDALFFGLAGKLSNEIKKLFGAEENDWERLKENPDYNLSYKAGSYANAIYGVVNLGQGLKQIATSGGTVVVNGSGEVVSVVSGSEEAALQAITGTVQMIAGIVNATSSNSPSSGDEGTSKAGFKTQELLDSHFKKHAAEFGNITKEQYLKGAQDLVSSKPGGNILTKVRPNGDTIFYNKISNEFAVKTSDGIIRTYFKPTDGINYFNRQ